MLRFSSAKHFSHMIMQLLISIVQTKLWVTTCFLVYTPELLAEKYVNVLVMKLILVFFFLFSGVLSSEFPS